MESFSALLAICAGFPVNSSHKGQWRGALMFSLICASINDWVNNHEAGKWRHHRGHYDVNVMAIRYPIPSLERLTFLETYAYWGVIEAMSLREQRPSGRCRLLISIRHESRSEGLCTTGYNCESHTNPHLRVNCQLTATGVVIILRVSNVSKWTAAKRLIDYS